MISIIRYFPMIISIWAGSHIWLNKSVWTWIGQYMGGLKYSGPRIGIHDMSAVRRIFSCFLFLVDVFFFFLAAPLYGMKIISGKMFSTLTFQKWYETKKRKVFSSQNPSQLFVSSIHFLEHFQQIGLISYHILHTEKSEEIHHLEFRDRCAASFD